MSVRHHVPIIDLHVLGPASRSPSSVCLATYQDAIIRVSGLLLLIAYVVVLHMSPYWLFVQTNCVPKPSALDIQADLSRLRSVL